MKPAFYIDGVGSDEFGVLLLAGYTVGSTPVSRSRLKPSGIVQGWVSLSTEYDLRTITLPLHLFGPTRRDAAIQKSRLDAALASDPVELLLPNGLYYTASLDSAGDTTEFTLDGTQLECTYQFLGYAHDPLMIQQVSDGQFFATGTSPAMACRLSCVVGKSTPSYQMAGVTWTNVNAGDRLVVDGLEKRVLCNGVNAINQTDLVSWPTLRPGLNHLVAPDTLTVAYYPIWQ